MPSSLKVKNRKTWYKSKTIWLLVAQLLIVGSSVVTGDMGTNTAVGVSMTTVAGFIVRYYTDSPIK